MLSRPDQLLEDAARKETLSADRGVVDDLEAVKCW